MGSVPGSAKGVTTRTSVFDDARKNAAKQKEVSLWPRYLRRARQRTAATSTSSQ